MTTPSEKEALEWLGALRNSGLYGWRRNARTLQSMLSRPRMPEEAGDDMVIAMLIADMQGGPTNAERLRRIYRALYSLLSNDAKPLPESQKQTGTAPEGNQQQETAMDTDKLREAITWARMRVTRDVVPHYDVLADAAESTLTHKADDPELRKAIDDMTAYLGDPYRSMQPGTMRKVLEAARSFLPPEPKTKMVEVWRVEWASRVVVEDGEPFWLTTARHYEREHVARVTAKTLESEGINAFIRVTGPHMQEVPA